MPAYPFGHPHLCYLHLLYVCILDWPTLYLALQSRFNYHSVELTFLSLGETFCHTVLWIQVPISLLIFPFPWIIDPIYLKLSLGYDLSINLHFHPLLHYRHCVIELAVQVHWRSHMVVYPSLEKKISYIVHTSKYIQENDT